MSNHLIWIKNPLAIYTANQQNADNGIVVDTTTGTIVELVANDDQPQSQFNKVFNADGHVVTPGLINTHHHLYQTLTRAFPDAINKPLFPWLKTLYPIWAKLQPEMIYSSTQLGLAELIMSGCTTVADHHYLFPKAIEDAIDIQVEAADEMGARVTLTRGSMSLGEKDGGLPPQQTVQSDEEILRDSERLISRYHDRQNGSMVNIALAPCSPFSVTKELMVETARLARQHKVMLHTHLAETEDENAFCLDRFGMRPVDYLESVGWMSEDVWLAHGIYFNDEEIQRLGHAKVGGLSLSVIKHDLGIGYLSNKRTATSWR